MKLTNQSSVPVYTISGSSTARPLPEWLARKRKRSLKHDPEYANRIELLQDFEFEEASACVRASEDGDWVVSTGVHSLLDPLKPSVNMMYRYIQASDAHPLPPPPLLVLRTTHKLSQPDFPPIIIRLLQILAPSNRSSS